MKQIVRDRKKIPIDQWPNDLKIQEYPNEAQIVDSN
jgi:hypothetical protein